MFLGDGMGKTVITGSLEAGQAGVTNYTSATLGKSRIPFDSINRDSFIILVGVLVDGFLASDLTIQKTAGSVMHQAVAYRSESDRSVLDN